MAARVGGTILTLLGSNAIMVVMTLMKFLISCLSCPLVVKTADFCRGFFGGWEEREEVPQPDANDAGRF